MYLSDIWLQENVAKCLKERVRPSALKWWPLTWLLVALQVREYMTWNCIVRRDGDGYVQQGIYSHSCLINAEAPCWEFEIMITPKCI